MADYQPGDVVENLTSAPDDTVTLYAIWEMTDTFGSLYGLRVDPSAAVRYVKEYTYDLAGNRTHFVMTLLTNGEQQVHDTVYIYDALNRLTAVANWGDYEAQYTYDVNGNRTSVVYRNEAREDYTYNKANWVTNIVNSSGGVTTSEYTYTYYASGNRRSETDHLDVTTTYTYDNLGRLTSESDTNNLTIAYAYDAAGNRTRMTVSGSENYTTTYTYDANNRLKMEQTVGGGKTPFTTYLYDANGNLTASVNPAHRTDYAYNGFDQLVFTYSGRSGTAYTYNAQGIRTGKSINCGLAPLKSDDLSGGFMRGHSFRVQYTG